MFNDRIRDEFKDFIERPDTFSLGVCNGCQVMALLGMLKSKEDEAGLSLSKLVSKLETGSPRLEFPGRASIRASTALNVRQPRFVRNESGIFESRFVTVKINPSPSIFLREMEGSVLGIWVAHAEGRCLWPARYSILDTRYSTRIENPESRIEQELAPIRFVDDDGKETEQYPFNPNGSRLGVTGICSRDGRHLALMPHPERLFQVWQWPFWPTHWSGLKASPWLKLFQNVREWCEKNPGLSL